MIILTDGNSNNKEQTISQALRAKQADIHIITVGPCLRSIQNHSSRVPSTKFYLYKESGILMEF